MKYHVTDVETGKTVLATFVLDPSVDPAAIAALQKYAEITEDKKVASEIYDWLEVVEMYGTVQPPKCDYCEEFAKVKGSPFMADAGAKMCERCWNDTREEYKNSHGEDIGDFVREEVTK